ncbi:MAG TPA: hypothetical protein VGF01_12175 [Terracidiphilus sp.]
MKYDSDPLDPNSFDEQQNVEATDEENLAAYMTSEMARTVFEAELEAMARGEFPGPTPRIGAWTEAHELMAEVESPSYLPMDTARGESFEEDEELSLLMHDQGTQFASDGYPSRSRIRAAEQTLRVASNREVLRRIRRPRAFSNFQKRPRRAAYFPPVSRRMNPEDK